MSSPITRRSTSAGRSYLPGLLSTEIISLVGLISLIALSFVPALTRVAAHSPTQPQATTTKGDPAINSSHRREVLTSLARPADLPLALEQNRVEPLSLAAADFDEDGMTDYWPVTNLTLVGNSRLASERGTRRKRPG
jgi:hypothetical protein